MESNHIEFDSMIVYIPQYFSLIGKRLSIRQKINLTLYMHKIPVNPTRASNTLEVPNYLIIDLKFLYTYLSR